VRFSRFRQPLTRPRRGATLVFVGLLLTVILGIAAVAIDLSRLYVGVNELQTAVDAAALRGALALQNGTANPTNAVTTFLTTTNPVMGTFVSSSNITVEARRYEANGSWTATTFASTLVKANAVRVVATQPSNLLFGLAAELPSFTPRRAATARIATVGLTCVKPWMFEAVRVVGRHVNTPSNPPSEADYASMRNDALVKNGTLNTRVHVVLAPPTDTRTNFESFYGTSVAGRWIGVDLPSVNGSNGGYQNSINTCNAGAIVPPYADLENEGTSSSVVTVAVNQAFNPSQGICTSRTDDTCQALVPVILGRPNIVSAGFGADGDYDVLYQTTFQLVCLKRRQNNPFDCPSASGIVNWSNPNVRAGTMFGYLNITLPVFSGNVAVSAGGSSGSTSQRLLLVE